MKPIISVKNLSKKFQIREKLPYYSLRDSLAQIFTGSKRKNADSFWALKDVSFDVFPGEVLGIIGRNGAGKSTLLKILSQITPPTSGTATLEGRVASLLEVGTGFHPELTGRENIYLNGAILGMSRKEIKKKFEEIVDFAEIEKFLDTPVKHYSSGMYMRLAFAVAAHLEPEILLVDEVLAVGDANFQKKSLNKIENVKKRGKTVILVSHNLSAITSLCSRALLINEGRLVYHGHSDKVVEEYYKLIREKHFSLADKNPGSDHKKSIFIKKVIIKTVAGGEKEIFEIGDDLVLEIHYLLLQKVQNLILGISIFDAKGGYIFGTNTKIDNYNLQLKRKNDKISLILRDINLLKGEYAVSVGATLDNNWQFPAEQIANTVWFKIKDDSYTSEMEGSTFIKHEWKSK